jgi:surface polysaccharide O-acyltransferase-like enzyme
MPRIKSLDLARGFTVVMIVPVHTMLLYSKPEVYATLPGQLLAFIAEGPGAPLFMVLMGISFALKEQPTLSGTLKKAAALLLAGYGLNVIKFVLPYQMGLMPGGLQEYLQVPGKGAAWTLLGIGDILQFAAPTLLLLYSVTRFRYFSRMALGLAILVCWLAPFAWDAHSACPLLKYVWQLATGQSPRTFFPMLPWLVYPLVGLALGRFLKRDAAGCFKLCGGIGMTLIALDHMFQCAFPNIRATSFYRTYPHETMGHVGVVLVALYGWDLLHRFVKPNLFWRILTYSSQHITQIYLIQWPLLFLWLPVIGYQRLEWTATLFVMFPMTAATYFLSALINASTKNGLTI